MGSIWFINDPNEWVVLKPIGVSKVNENDTVLSVKIGEGNDGISTYDITVFMSEEIYNKAKAGKYDVKRRPFCEPEIMLYDDGEVIPLVMNTDYGLIDLNKRYEEPKIRTLKPHNNSKENK